MTNGSFFPARPPAGPGAAVGRLRRALDRIGQEAIVSRRAPRPGLDLALEAAAVGWWDHAPAEERWFWDGGMRDLFGLGPTDPVGPDVAMALSRPEDRDRFADALALALDPEGPGVFAAEYLIRRPLDGVQRWIRSRGRALFENGTCVRLVGIAEDITAPKSVELAFRDGSERLALALDAAEIGIWSAGPSLSDLQWDDRVRALFGLPPGAAVDRDINLRAIHGDDRPRVEAAIRDAFDPDGDGLYDVSFRVLGIEDGVERTLRAKGRVRFEHSRATGFLGAVRDISAERRAAELLADAATTLERRVAQRTASLEQASVALARSRKMEAMGQLTGAVAHDINNILTGIGGSLELLAQRVRQGRLDDVARLIGRAEEAVDRAASLTERMLAFSRVQPQEAWRIDLNAALELLRPTLQDVAGSVSLSVSADPSRPHVLADPDLLRSALLGLVQNSREALGAIGSVRIAVSVAPIGRQAAEAGDNLPRHYAVLAVSDNGPGMSETVADRAFDPFFTTKPLGQDQGLGLSIVWGFARQSGGFARVDSEPGKGTTVSISLPLAETLEAAAAMPSAARTVLVVTDDEMLRPVVTEALAELGCAVLQAGSDAAGLRIAADEVPVDLVIADFGSAGALDGRKLVEEAARLRPGLKAVLITGGDGDAASAPAADDALILRKPFTMRELADRVTTLLGPAASAG